MGLNDPFDMTMGDIIKELLSNGFVQIYHGVFMCPNRELTDRDKKLCDHLFHEWDCTFEKYKDNGKNKSL